jgi:hypothetical protein
MRYIREDKKIPDGFVEIKGKFKSGLILIDRAPIVEEKVEKYVNAKAGEILPKPRKGKKSD